MPLASNLIVGNTDDQVTLKLPRLRAPKGGLVVAGRLYRAGVFLPETARPVLEALTRPTVTTPAPVRTIGILGFSYRVEAVAIAPSIGDVAYSLHDIDRNRHYHIHRDRSGEVVCDCGDFTFRRQGLGQPCKHGRALLSLGLIPSARLGTSPAPEPVGEAESDPATWPAWTDEPIPFRPVRPATAPARRRRFEPTADEYRLAAAILNA